MDNIATDGDETYLLLLLADSNLPTGSFVASAGLESFVAHGFFDGSNDNLNNTVNFIRDSVATYARSALPFVADVHRVVMKGAAEGCVDDLAGSLDRTYEEIKALDDLYEAMTLNHVARRASKSQGVALLTLYTKGFSPPTSLSIYQTTTRDTFIGKLVSQLKLRIRREEMQGHLPICWGILTAALNISLGKSHLFHAPAQHTYLRLSVGRSIIASSSFPPRKEPPFRSRKAEHDWAICITAASAACHPAHR
jgi:urease accessory protein